MKKDNLTANKSFRFVKRIYFLSRLIKPDWIFYFRGLRKVIENYQFGSEINKVKFKFVI